MNKEIKEKWVAALRSGEYKQAEGILYDPKQRSYCCLGVLCKIVEGHNPTDADTCDEGEYLAYDIIEKIELPHETQRKLAKMNDGSGIFDSETIHPHSFSEIADYIERNL